MLSGRARFGARLVAGLLGATALVLPASSSGAPERAASVSVSNVKLTATWKEGWLTAKLRFTLDAGAATSVSASVRPVVPGPVAAHVIYTLSAGSATETIKLPARLPPREYVLNITGAAPTKFTIPTPDEGVVDSAIISLTATGKAVRSAANPHQLFVRFHFLTGPPSAKSAKIEWRTPTFTFVGAVTKPYAATIQSDLKSNSPLPRGHWYAILTVAGKTAKRIDVTVT
ncbi:MAG TPA: hypothetical protein VGM80_04645 [Gaiellaceae bacterium]|jgi:hypothetical protein